MSATGVQAGTAARWRDLDGSIRGVLDLAGDYVFIESGWEQREGGTVQGFVTVDGRAF